MKTMLSTGAAVVIGIVFAGTASAQTSQAQTKDEAKQGATTSDEYAPATRSVELSIGTGYEQGFGKVASASPSLTHTGIAGADVQVGVGYRLLPELTLGVYGSGAEFARGDEVDSTTNIYSAAAGVRADWHFLPAAHQIDPWLSLGTGWRGYWVHSSAGTASLQGLELAKLQVGVDFRIDQAIAIAPVIGADLSTFVTQATPQSDGFSNIQSPEVNTFVFAGVQGRFDIPTESGRTQVASR